MLNLQINMSDNQHVFFQLPGGAVITTRVAAAAATAAVDQPSSTLVRVSLDFLIWPTIKLKLCTDSCPASS